MRHPRRARRATRRALIGVTAFLLGIAALPLPAAAALPTWPANPNWQSLVPAPTSDSVRAVAVTRTSGTVTNAAGLAGSGTGSAVLTTSATSSPATVILDFGKEVGGTPFITVSSSATATVRVATSEALPYLTASNGIYNNDNGSPVTFGVNGARTYTGALLGGFRFAAIQLTTAGRVTLTAAGVNFGATGPPPTNTRATSSPATTSSTACGMPGPTPPRWTWCPLASPPASPCRSSSTARNATAPSGRATS